jgi:hypothetical protein
MDNLELCENSSGQEEPELEECIDSERETRRQLDQEDILKTARPKISSNQSPNLDIDQQLRLELETSQIQEIEESSPD